MQTLAFRINQEEPHLQDNEGEDEEEVHAPDEVLVDPNNPQVAGPFPQGVDPAVEHLTHQMKPRKAWK